MCTAQTFNERWSVIPKAHAEPAAEIPGQTKQDPHAQPQLGGEPTRGSEDRSAPRSFNRVFSGKASYYSYRTGKTASGSFVQSEFSDRGPPQPAVRHESSRHRSNDQQVGNSSHHRPRTEGRPRPRPFARRRAQPRDHGSWRGPGSR
jgi:hypothetical protein